MKNNRNSGISMFYKILFLCTVGLIKGQELCSKACTASYPLHTEDKVAELQACTKGCRLQFISFLSGKAESCESDCGSAYQKSKSQINACVLGCKEQARIDEKPSFPQLEESNTMTFHIRLLHPVFTMKRYCFNMFHSAASYVRSSSYVMERSSTDENGNSVFMHFEMFPIQDMSEIEHKYESEEKLIKTETSSHFKRYIHKLHGHASRWLNCVEGKAGVPYATLVAVLFFSLAMVAWICCSTCDEHENEEEEESKQKRHTFSKGGLSIQADDMKDARVFTIIASQVDDDDAEKLLLA